MPFDGATATPTGAGQEGGGDASQKDPYRFLSTRLVRELIAADLRAEAAGDDPPAIAARLLEVVAEGLGQLGAALLDGSSLEPLASVGLENEERALLGADPASGGRPLPRRALEERRVLLLGPGSRDTLLPALREIRSQWTGLVLVPLWDRDRTAGVLALLSAGATMPAAVLRSLTPAFRLLTLLLHPGRRAELFGAGEASSAADSEHYLVEIEELRVQLNEAHEQYRALQDQDSSSQAAQRAESESLRARVAELEAALAVGGNAMVEAFESERVRLSTELDARTARIRELEGEVGELTERLSSAEAAKDEAERRAEASASAAESLRLAMEPREPTPEAGEIATSLPMVDGEEFQLGEIAEAAAAAMGDGEASAGDSDLAAAPELDVGDPATGEQAVADASAATPGPSEGAPVLGLWHLASDPAAHAWAGELAERCGARLWTGEGEPPRVERTLLVLNLFDPSVAQAIELAQDDGDVDSVVYALDGESGQGFEIGSVGWIRRPLDPATALRRIRERVTRRLGGIVIVSAQLRELAGLRQALAEVDAAGSVACDARQATDLLEIVRRPDAVLIDLALGDGQGLALARQLRTTPETREVPLVFLLPEEIRAEQLRADAERARILGPYGTEDARRLVNGALARFA